MNLKIIGKHEYQVSSSGLPDFPTFGLSVFRTSGLSDYPSKINEKTTMREFSLSMTLEYLRFASRL